MRSGWHLPWVIRIDAQFDTSFPQDFQLPNMFLGDMFSQATVDTAATNEGMDNIATGESEGVIFAAVARDHDCRFCR